AGRPRQRPASFVGCPPNDSAVVSQLETARFEAEVFTRRRGCLDLLQKEAFDMSTNSLRDLVAEIGTTASTLAILGAQLEARVSGRPLHRALQPHVDDVLRRIGAVSALEGASPDELWPLIAEIRHFWLLDSDFL